MNHTKVLRRKMADYIEVLKYQLEDRIGKVRCHSDIILTNEEITKDDLIAETLNHAIKCCKIVEKLPNISEIYNYLSGVGIGTVKTAQAIYNRIMGAK